MIGVAWWRWNAGSLAAALGAGVEVQANQTAANQTAANQTAANQTAAGAGVAEAGSAGAAVLRAGRLGPGGDRRGVVAATEG